MNFPYLVRFQPVLLSLFRFITGLLLFQYGCRQAVQVSGASLLRKHPADHLRSRYA
ncbi:hypothetical protein ACVWZK_005852 [Bradyrhizobium sp. GM0.4]